MMEGIIILFTFALSMCIILYTMFKDPPDDENFYNDSPYF